MIKKMFILCVAMLWTVTLMAQQIAVVSGGNTTVHRTLQEAIEAAPAGSVIYLPGGGFPIADSVKITKKLTIIGIGHKAKNENVDGVTTISGNMFFDKNSDSSALMSCYVTGNVNIGNDGNEVDDVLIKYCNLNNVYVRNSLCMETNINQNYVRGGVAFGNSKGLISNNLVRGSISGVDNGIISNNIIESGSYGIGANNSDISYNIIFADGKGGYGWQHYMIEGNNNTVYNNMARYNCGDYCINIGEINWDDVFANFNGGAASPVSDFHFKEAYQQYEGQVGIYHGTFNDAQMAPVPYIVAKQVDEQTDANGKLNIKIRVRAGE